VNSSTEDAAAGTVASVKIGETVVASYDGVKLTGDELAAAKKAFETGLNDALKAAGYPVAGVENTTIAKAENFVDIFTGQKLLIVAILTYLIILVTMVYGPIAAMLVELFPTRIRYSGLSLPYHIGNGWFGGLLPATAFAISAQTGNIYYGPVVRDHRRPDDGGDRCAVRAERNPQERHLRRRRVALMPKRRARASALARTAASTEARPLSAGFSGRRLAGFAKARLFLPKARLCSPSPGCRT
jgi:hypothetical protein